MEPFRATKIADKIYWVGAIDWSIRDFHGYATNRGTTYNAFLILDDKITLIDTVKAQFKEEMLSRIASVIDPTEIEYIVSNHSELDHSACLPDMIQIARPEKVFASKMGLKALSAHLPIKMEITAVGDGETIEIGKKSLTFVETRMLHWPDSMFTYIDKEAVLFSQDAFGMHLASSERFDDELDLSILECEAAKYYANILLPYSSMVIKLLEKVNKLDLSLKMILPDHGPVWRRNGARIIELYKKWSSGASDRTEKKAVIVYATMWNSTAKMAAAIAEGLMVNGISVKTMPLGASQRSDVATELLDADAIIVGSPTLNNNMFPTVADLLIYIKGLRFTGLVGGAFGSYGWSGEAVKQIEDSLRDMKIEIAADPVKVRYVPDDNALNDCHQMGAGIAEKLKAASGSL